MSHPSSNQSIPRKNFFHQLYQSLFPIFKGEYTKLLLLFLIMFLVCFNYSILRNAKDTVVILAKGSGARVIPCIKVIALLPGAIFITWIYAKLASRFKRETVFHLMITGFVAFFLLFAFWMYPQQESLAITDFAKRIQNMFPSSTFCKNELFLACCAMIEHWHFTLFYVISETWSSMIIGVLFWGLSNELNTLGEAKRFYGILNVGSTVAAIAAGQTAIFFTQTFSEKLSKQEIWQHNLASQTLIVTVSSILVMILIRALCATEKKKLLQRDSSSTQHNKKPRLSVRESIKFIFSSRYLIWLACIVVAYNLCINLSEVIWKDKVSELYTDKSDFNIYLNQLTSLMGIVSTILAIFIPMIIQRLGWTTLAMITPIVMLITASGFFIFQLGNGDLITATALMFHTTPLAITVFFGSANNLMSKAGKYSVFDGSKEIAFTLIDHESRLKGKAAIDGVGSRFGKFGGSCIQLFLMSPLALGSLAAATPFIAGILGIMISVWIFSTLSLGTSFNLLARKQEQEEAKANH